MPESVSRRSSAPAALTPPFWRYEASRTQRRVPPTCSGAGARAGSVRRGLAGVGHAEVVVFGDDDVARVLAAGRALRVTVDLEGAERLLQGVIRQQATDERIA